MPTYDYSCSSCGEAFEKLCKIAERENATQEPCPNCGDIAVKLLISAPNIVSPFHIDGLIRPRSDFRDRMKQIKHNLRYAPGVDIKDY